MAVTPNSTKVRQTKVAMEWYYDPNRGQWRLLAADLAHGATYDRVDGAGNPLQPARTHEQKGWLPATQALQFVEEARVDVPAPVKAKYGHLIPEPAGKGN